ncbi:MAG: hypothetical protein JW395_3311 [Nitrospira sp.]|nr:hypothetical protein [Nitrospira sp.]
MNTILAYLAHWLAAPSWSSDVCKHHGIPDLELGEFISKYWNTLGNIQTPKELYGFLVAMMEDGLEPVNPPEASDYDANPVKIAR